MMTSKVVDLGFANLCCALGTAGHVETFKNFGDGSSTQITYVLTGSAKVYSEDGSKELLLEAGKITNMEPLMDEPFTGQINETPLGWVSINPIPSHNRYSYQLVRGGENLTVVGNDSKQVVISLYKDVEANGVVIEEHKFANIPSGKTVTVSAAGDAVAIVLTAR